MQTETASPHIPQDDYRLMMQSYHGHGVRFDYPEEWELSEQSDELETVITVASPETSFWSLTLFHDLPAPEKIVTTVLDVFHEEYESIDVYDLAEDPNDQWTVGRQVEFFCLELVNSAWIRTFSAPLFTGLVLYQGTDQELETTLPVFEQITQTLTWDAGETLDVMPFWPVP